MRSIETKYLYDKCVTFVPSLTLTTTIYLCKTSILLVNGVLSFTTCFELFILGYYIFISAEVFQLFGFAKPFKIQSH